MNTGFFDDAFEMLRDLGLTIVQAKVYLALVRSEAATIGRISELSKVPRTDLYRVVKELEKKGLVERVLAHPIRFRAVPFAEVLHVLLQRRNEEMHKFRARAIQLLQNSRDEQDFGFGKSSETRFVLVPSSRVAEKIARAIDEAQESIDLVLSWARFSRGFFVYSENLDKAWSRNVKCRMIIEKSDQGLSPDQMTLCQKENCEMKLVDSLPKTVLGIYDGREVFIIENPAAELSGSPALWSNNSSLVALAKDFFDMLWLTSLETPTL